MNNDFDYHNTSDPTSARSSWKERLGIHTLSAKAKKDALIALIVLLVLVAFGFAISRSLPGEALYGLKTNFLEELDAAVQFTDTSRARQEINRMEERLSETQALAEKPQVSEEALAVLHSQIVEHQTTFTDIINRLEDEGVPHTDALVLLEDFTNVAAAIEYVSENDPELEAWSEQVEDVRSDISNLHEDWVDTFVQSAEVEAIYEFIRSRLAAVSEALQDPDLSAEVIDDAEVYIDRVEPAMSDGDFPRVITSLAEARRFIAIEEYAGVLEEPQGASPETQEETATTSTSTPTSTEIQNEAGTNTQTEQGAFTFPQ